MAKGRTGRVLILTPVGRDGPLAAQVLQGAGLSTEICRHAADLLAKLDAETAAVLLAEEALSAASLQSLVAVLREQEAWSDIPILFLVREGLAASAHSQRALALSTVTTVTTLDRPFRQATLISAVQGALRARQRQWQVRDLLEQRRRSEAALQEAKDRAESANRAKDDFLAALSHELRTPLTPVLMAVSQLRADSRLPEDAIEDLAMIERNVGLEARLIDDLLDLTRIAQGKLPLRISRCDVHALFAHAAEIVREERLAKGIKLQFMLEAEHSSLRGDPVRLQQVFWNLLKNAVKFTPSGGAIAVRTVNVADRLHIQVTDNGYGFDPGAAEAIFRPFEQGGRENDHRFGGLGLGLAIARAIIEKHSGTIVAESRGPGRGASFSIALPSPLPSIPELASTLGSPEHGVMEAPAGLRVLVVEDHEATSVMLSRLLRRSGYEVVTAHSVTSALEVIDGCEKFDALISDLGLPDGTGLDLMCQVRERCAALPGIVVSGYGMEEDVARSRAAGFSAHLIKPINFDQLRRTLHELLSPVAEKAP